MEVGVFCNENMNSHFFVTGQIGMEFGKMSIGVLY